MVQRGNRRACFRDLVAIGRLSKESTVLKGEGFEQCNGVFEQISETGGYPRVTLRKRI